LRHLQRDVRHEEVGGLRRGSAKDVDDIVGLVDKLLQLVEQRPRDEAAKENCQDL
jgi:hypothetical protein